MVHGVWKNGGLRGCQKGPYHISNMLMNKQVIGVIDFKSEVKCDLQGCLEAVVASQAAKGVHTI